MKKRWLLYFVSMLCFFALGIMLNSILKKKDFYMTGADAAQTIQVSETVIDSHAKPQEGDCIGRVEIPSLYLEYPLYRGSNEMLLHYGLLNVMESGYSGSGQDVAIQGLRANYFKKLYLLKIGDKVRLKMFNGNVQYTVREVKQIPLNDETIFKDSGRNQLILYCDYPFSPMSIPLKRYVVFCEIE